MATWLIVLIVYIVGAAIAWLFIRKWNNTLMTKVLSCAVWPGTLILYVIHKMHMGL